MKILLLLYAPILMFLYIQLNKKIKCEFKFDKKFAMILSFIIGAVGLYFYNPISSKVILENLIFLSVLITLLNITIIDIEKFIIPDTYNAIIVGLGILNVAFIKTHYLFFIMAALSFILFLFIATISRGSLGMGDVKLSFGLGLFLDILLFKSFLMYTFGIGAIIGLILILSKVMKSNDKFAFGPFMALGFTLALLI